MPKTLLGELTAAVSLSQTEENFLQQQHLPHKYAQDSTKDWRHIAAILPSMRAFNFYDYKNILESTRQELCKAGLTQLDMMVGFSWLLQLPPKEAFLTEPLLIELLRKFNEIITDEFNEIMWATIALLLTLLLKVRKNNLTSLAVDPALLSQLKIKLEMNQALRDTVLFDYVLFCLDDLYSPNPDSWVTKYLMPLFSRLGYVGSIVAITIVVLGVVAAIVTTPVGITTATIVLGVAAAVLPTATYTDFFTDLNLVLKKVKNKKHRGMVTYYHFIQLFYTSNTTPPLYWHNIFLGLKPIFKDYPEVKKSVSIMLLSKWREQIIKYRKDNTQIIYNYMVNQPDVYRFLETRLKDKDHKIGKVQTRMWFQIMVGMMIVENIVNGFWYDQVEYYIRTYGGANSQRFIDLREKFIRETSAPQDVTNIPNDISNLSPEQLTAVNLIQRRWLGDDALCRQAELLFDRQSFFISNIQPLPVPHVSTGTMLSNLEQALLHNKPVVIAGLPGAGKTTLTMNYASSRPKESIIWIFNFNNENNDTLLFQEYAALATKLGISIRTIGEINIVYEHLNRLGRPWLLAFENVKEVLWLLDRHHGQRNNWARGTVLITSRDNYINAAVVTTLDMLLTLDEALSIMSALAPMVNPVEEVAAREIAGRLGLPFYLNLAGHYIQVGRQTNGRIQTYQNYLDELDKFDNPEHQLSALERQMQGRLPQSPIYSVDAYNSINFYLKNITINPSTKVLLDYFVSVKNGSFSQLQLQQNLATSGIDALTINNGLNELSRYNIVSRTSEIPCRYRLQSVISYIYMDNARLRLRVYEEKLSSADFRFSVCQHAIWKFGLSILDDIYIAETKKDELMARFPTGFGAILKHIYQKKYFIISTRKWKNYALYVQRSNFGVLSSCKVAALGPTGEPIEPIKDPGTTGHFKFIPVNDYEFFNIVTEEDREDYKLFRSHVHPWHEILATKLSRRTIEQERFTLQPQTGGKEGEWYFILSTQDSPNKFLRVGTDAEGRCRGWATQDDTRQEFATHFTLRLVN